jgi:hypothetical protein
MLAEIVVAAEPACRGSFWRQSETAIAPVVSLNAARVRWLFAF